jgi:glycosyltransferase involved in cell wall biosynthesis
VKILHVISSLNPKSGGVAEAVLQLSAIHSDMAVDVSICCLDAPNEEWIKTSNFKVYALGPAMATYGFNRKLVPWLKAHACEFDAVIVNGLWQYTGLAVRLALSGSSTPYFVYPHGMLDPWFKCTYPLKHMKKWLYWPWAEYLTLRGARKVIFTCEEERLLSRKSFWLNNWNDAVTGLGVETPPANGDELASKFIRQYPHLQGKRIALYLSRIHVKKGCDLLIESFAKVAAKDERLHLVMAGPDQMGWVDKLQAQAEKLGIANRITWTGMLQGDLKWGAFYATEVFCLPSHQENFGIVVAEALACGKPVLISNKVNIWREIEEDGAGLVADDTLAGTNRNFERWLAMSPAEFESVKAKTIPCFERRFHVRQAAEKLLEVIRTSKRLGETTLPVLAD